MNGDASLYNQGKAAILKLARIYRQGTYRVIRDPEGVISFWAVEGLERSAFSISFANKGRISADIEVMPPEFVRAFIAYVNHAHR